MASKEKSRFSRDIVIKNRKARFQFNFLELIEAGIVLQGSEIKSIREGKVSLQEAYCYFSGNELYVKGMNISIYKESTYHNHEPTRERKLLLKQREIKKLKEKSEEKGLTIVPVKMYITARGLAKLQIALAKGKKIYDKRDSIKQREQDRELKQMKL